MTDIDQTTTKQPKPAAWKGGVFLLVVLAIFAVLGFFVIQNRSAEGPLVIEAEPLPLQVNVVTAKLQESFTIDEAFTGLATPRRTSQLGFSSGGRVQSLTVDVGDRVERGQRLGVLDTRALQAQRSAAAASVTEAQASHDLALATVTRQITLLEKGHVSKQLVDEATAQAERALKANPDRGILIAAAEGWHPGVIGIVAGRLKDRFHLPSIVIGWGEGLGPVAKGSARSVRGVNVGSAIAEAAEAGVILSGGGHAMAGGLSLDPDQLTQFDVWMVDHMAQFSAERDAALELPIDAMISPGTASVDFVERLEALGPFGIGAPQPVFAAADVSVTGARRIGTNHLRFIAEDASGRLECVAWRQADTPLGDAILGGGRLHIAGRLKADEWNGRKRVQLDLMDASIAG